MLIKGRHLMIAGYFDHQSSRIHSKILLRSLMKNFLYQSIILQV